MIIDGGSADMLEVREILLDLIEEDKRAGDVIGRLRDMLRKGESHQVLLNVNALVRGADAAREQRRPHPQRRRPGGPEPAAPLVTGDRIQLQQVV
jgi:C4-dicarboxylate-specific signal transduction histidine kinase